MVEAKEHAAENKITISVEQAAELIGISRTLAYQKVNSGELPARRIGNRWLVSKVRLEKWINGE